MSPNGELASGYWPLFLQVFLDTETIELFDADTVIRLGRRSKNAEEFTLRLNENGLKLCDSTDAVQVLGRIRQVFPPKPDLSRFAEPFVPTILRQEEIKIGLIYPSPEYHPYSRMNSYEKSHRALIEEHRSDLGHIQSRLALKADSIPPRDRPIPTIVNEDRERFPIFKIKNEIINSLWNYLIVIVVGETGSGKTTQIPQYLAEASFATRGQLIGCTQLCHEAAESATKMVPYEAIKYMDESTLCNELITDKTLSKYSVIMIDDAHERSITTDVLFALIKNVFRNRRTFFRLVVTSANSDIVERLFNYFGGRRTELGFETGCKTLVVPYRFRNQLSVDIQHLPLPSTDPLAQALWLVLDIRTKEPRGNILLFLSGKDEVDFACRILFDRAEDQNSNLPPLIVLRATSSLRGEIDPKVFETTPPWAFKVVVATEAAEAPLTAIGGIVCVIDLGLTERRVMHPLQAIDALEITPITKTSADRRSKLGRTSPGKSICYRLYTKAAYHSEMRPVAQPEFQTANLSAAILRIDAYRLNNMCKIDVIDHPPQQHVTAAVRQLYYLGAMYENKALSETGWKMSLFPLDPPWSRALIAGVKFECSSEVLTIVAMAQVDGTFFPPWENQAEAYQQRKRFFRMNGDHLSLLSVYNRWKESRSPLEWCDKNFVHSESLKKADDLRNRLASIMNQLKLLIIGNTAKNDVYIRKAIASGLFFHAAWKDSKEGYRTLVGNHRVYVHPESALYHRQPSWVIYNKLVLSDGKDCMFGVTAIEPAWLVKLAPRFFRKRC